MDPLLVDVYPQDVGGTPDWPALVAAGPPWHGAILKVSEGAGGTAAWQLNLAAWFRNQWPAIRAVAGARYGVDFFRGGYHYLLIGVDAAKQAEHYLQRIEDAGGWGDGDLWPIVDVERGSGNDAHGKQETIERTTVFAQTVRARTGRGVVLYGGSWLAELGIRDKMGCSWLWLPRYTAVLPPESYERIGWALDDLFAWQYAGDGVGKLDGYPLTSPIGKTDVSAVTMAGGGTKALEWLRTTLRPEPKRDLRVASPLMSGDDVREIQRRLAALRYATGVPDGVYGPRTAAAVQAFQRDHSLAIDGVVGPRTRAALAASP
jgi:hypothetical protein